MFTESILLAMGEFAARDTISFARTLSFLSVEPNFAF